jgi:hypothetical protein
MGTAATASALPEAVPKPRWGEVLDRRREDLDRNWTVSPALQGSPPWKAPFDRAFPSWAILGSNQ